MPALGSEGQWPREFLISDEGNYSRENITIVANAGAIPSGRMLGKITSGGKYDNYDAGASNGTEVCAGIALDDYPASTEDQSGVIIARHAEVKADMVAAEDSADTAAGRATLESSGVVFRS